MQNKDRGWMSERLKGVAGAEIFHVYIDVFWIKKVLKLCSNVDPSSREKEREGWKRGRSDQPEEMSTAFFTQWRAKDAVCAQWLSKWQKCKMVEGETAMGNTEKRLALIAAWQLRWDHGEPCRPKEGSFNGSLSAGEMEAKCKPRRRNSFFITRRPG